MPSQRARLNSRHGPRKTVLVWRCGRCREAFDYLPMLAIDEHGRKVPGCPTCKRAGGMAQVRIRD